MNSVEGGAAFEIFFYGKIFVKCGKLKDYAYFAFYFVCVLV